MSADDLQRFAEDLRAQLGLTVNLNIDADPERPHVLTINGVDIFFYADESGYDGWGRAIVPPPNPL